MAQMNRIGNEYVTQMRFSQAESDMFDALMEKLGIRERVAIARMALHEFARHHGVEVNRTAAMKKHGAKPVRLSPAKRKAAGWEG